MKVSTETYLFILIAVLLISGATYAQSPAKESYAKGVEYTIRGELT